MRAHEYGHLGLDQQGILPSDLIELTAKMGVDEVWLQSGMDVVVNTFMLACGNAEILDLRPRLERNPTAMPRYLAASAYLRAEALGCASSLRPKLRRAAKLDRANIAVLTAAAAFFRTHGETAAAIPKDRFTEWMKKLQTVFGPTPEPEDPSGTEDASSSPEIPADVALKESLLGELPSRNDWGEMEILTPSLPLPRANAIRRTRMHAGFSGALRYPQRALLPATDGRAFGVRRLCRQSSGTLLIDCSGSMLVTPHLLDKALEHAYSIVALYGGTCDQAERGRLVIVAARGRRADSQWLSSVQMGPGNVVDGPALEWLANQRTPRVWISDGMVTGKGDTTAVNLVLDAMRIVRQGRIRRIKSVKQLAAYPRAE